LDDGWFPGQNLKWSDGERVYFSGFFL